MVFTNSISQNNKQCWNWFLKAYIINGLYFGLQIPLESSKRIYLTWFICCIKIYAIMKFCVCVFNKQWWSIVYKMFLTAHYKSVILCRAWVVWMCVCSGGNKMTYRCFFSLYDDARLLSSPKHFYGQYSKGLGDTWLCST